MTSRDWRDYPTHYMLQGSTRNEYFHAKPDCDRIKNPGNAVERTENYLAYHEPIACTDCHPKVGLGEDESWTEAQP